MLYNEYLNGYIERKKGVFSGRLSIEGIDLGEIIGGFYADKKGRDYVWLRRAPVLEYNKENRKFIKRTAFPFFECYAFKSSQKNIAYEGKFVFLHFTYELCCCWDDIVENKLNIYVVRSNEQILINAINKKNKEYGNGII